MTKQLISEMRREDRRARMGLVAAQQPGDLGLAKLARELGVVELWHYLHAGNGDSAIARRASQINLDELERQTVGLGAHFIIPGDPGWSSGLGDLVWSEPVSDFGGEPFGLWVSGPGALVGAPTVAIVGSRAATAYGEHVAMDWALGLAQHGYTVISGGAYGIDAAAHRGAIAAKATTVAIMAGGLGRLYPSGNDTLLHRIRHDGLMISEAPPDCPPSRSRFLARNRLIAALAQATIIVEGAVRSGAQNTASWALSLGRPVLAAPGPVTSAMSVTPHRLVRNGQATLVTSLEDILGAL
ncbi:MAG: DNA-processing protein DprA, partial [Propionibacteriaceae bacterium]|nr:DNA-processing protein DprA [Propionibacteriaceae bacterium]